MTYIRYQMLAATEGQSLERPAAAGALAELLRPVLGAEGLHRGVMGLPINLVVTHRGAALEATVQDARGNRLAAYSIALRDRGARRVWQDLHEAVLGRPVTDPERPPQAPWVGLALDDRTREHPREMVHAIIALAKVSAWIWHDMRRLQDN